jgi:chromosome segregation ATPase
MVRSVEMAQDQPRYWQTLAHLHRKMHSYDEAFDALEHFARLSVNRADRVEAEREALQASLQEAGESALHVAEELARVRKVFEEEQLARESFHQEQEQTKMQMETLRKNVEASKKEAEKYKGWLEGIRNENRMCKVWSTYKQLACV